MKPVRAITVGRQDVDMYAVRVRDILAVSTSCDLAQAHTTWLLTINTGPGIFSAKVLAAERLPESHKHDWEVEIECDEVEALREALTYEVSGRTYLGRELCQATS